MKRSVRAAVKTAAGPRGSESQPAGPNRVTQVARRQSALVEQVEELDENTRAMGLALAWIAVPLTLIPGRAKRSDPRLFPWRPSKDWWRRDSAHTERVGDRMIPALRARLLPIKAAGG